MGLRITRGFTLVELLTVVSVIAILAAIAYPSYLRYTIKSNRSAAQSYLMDAAQRQQQFLQDSRAYATDYTTTTLNDAPPAEVTKFYKVTFATDTTNPACTPALPAPCFLLTATPLAGTMQASDAVLTLDSAGNKTPSSLW